MLPVCSATSCSSHSQILLYDGLRYFRSQSALNVSVRWVSGDTLVHKLSSGVSPEKWLPKEAANSLYSEFLGGRKLLSNEWPYRVEKVSDSLVLGREHLKYVEDTTAFVSSEYAGEAGVENADIFVERASTEPATVLDNFAVGDTDVPDVSSIQTDSLQITGNAVENSTSQAVESIGDSISKVENALNSSVDKVTSTITDITKEGNDAIERLSSNVFSSVDKTGEITRNKLNSLPGDLKAGTETAGGLALELLRKSIILVEDSLVKGSKLVYYSYEASKELLPPEFLNAVNSFEVKSSELLKPVGVFSLQAYSAIEGVERSLGLDPSDPVVPFVIFLGTASTLWTIYWVVSYSGYAGDLSPKLAFDLLKGKDSAVLTDVRPEEMKLRDGIPDLRRTARSRYADVSLPQVDDSLRKLMKSSRDLDDALIASVICNLKNVQDRSKVIVMDVDGSRAKGIARALRKLGVKRPYVLQGGFQSWVKEGLRAKELKPETAISILNEEAEAILEELRPSPLQLLGFGVGSIAALYALAEWQKSLQIIGVIGLVQTIYRRLASYEDSEDFREDVRLLLSPVTMGAQALTWASGKVETNGNGLPVSPSSPDVQSRVLQAAAKHESQPFDAEGSQDSVTDSTGAVNGSADPSES